MDRRLMTVLVVLSVVLAGCGGLFSSGNESPSDRTSTPQPTTTGKTTETVTETGTGTDTTTPTQADTERIDYPPGYSASGITNPEKAIKQHVSALRTHDSYTYTLKLPTNNLNARIDLTTKVNTTNKRLYKVVNGSLSGKRLFHTERYQVKNTSYKLSSRPTTDRPSFKLTIEPFSTPFTNSIPRDLPLWGLLRNISFGDAKQVTRGGETFLRYESTKLRNANAFLSSTVEGEVVTVNEFNATLLVDEEGIVRSFNYAVTYTVSVPTQLNQSSGTGQMNGSTNGASSTRQVSWTVMIRISNIDSTTVEKPQWLNEAKQRTSRPPILSQNGNTTTA